MRERLALCGHYILWCNSMDTHNRLVPHEGWCRTALKICGLTGGECKQVTFNRRRRRELVRWRIANVACREAASFLTPPNYSVPGCSAPSVGSASSTSSCGCTRIRVTPHILMFSSGFSYVKVMLLNSWKNSSRCPGLLYAT